MNPGLLGYEYFYESTIAPKEPLSRAIAGSLAATGIDARDIDMLIVASADVDFLADRQFLPELLQRNGLSKALPLAITSQECTGLLSAINLASAYVKSGSFAHILVVSYDRAKDDAHRIQTFGVLSDAASACVVTSGSDPELRIRGFSHKSDLRGMQGGDDFASRKALTNAVTDDVLAQGGVALAGVSKVFATNFFKPVARYNASNLGLGEHQLGPDRAPGFAHCQCADPLLNLSLFQGTDETAGDGGLYLLQAYAPGFLASMLVERVRATTGRHAAAASPEAVVQSW